MFLYPTTPWKVRWYFTNLQGGDENKSNDYVVLRNSSGIYDLRQCFTLFLERMTLFFSTTQFKSNNSLFSGNLIGNWWALPQMQIAPGSHLRKPTHARQRSAHLSSMLLLLSFLSQLLPCAVSSSAGFPGQRKRLRHDMLNGKQPRRMQTNWRLCHHSMSWQRSLEVLLMPSPAHKTCLFFWGCFLCA